MSALIWAAIVAVWGFVLIPMWLRRHDTASEQRSTERFTGAMRVLSRRPSGHDEADPDQFDSDHERLGGVRGTGMSHADSRDPIAPVESAPAGPPAAQGESGGWRDAPPGTARDSYAARVAARPGSPADSDGAAPVDAAGSLRGPAPQLDSAGPRTPGGSGSGSGTGPGAAGRPATLGWPGTPGGPGTSGRAATSARAGASGRPGSAGDDGMVRGDEPRVDSRRTVALHRVAAERAALMRVRRQRLILVAALLPVTVVLAAVFGGMWIAVQLLTDLGFAGYLFHLRRAAQVERRLAITRVSIERRIEAERVARSRRRSVGSSFAYHERDSAASTSERHLGPEPAEELTPEELAHARAETIDLGSLMATQLANRDDTGPDDGTYAEGPAAADGRAGYAASAGWDEAAPSRPASGGHAKVLYGYAPSVAPAGYDGVGYDDYDYDYDEVEVDADEVAAASAARMTARPATRPT
uniref:gephyrin-like molybdotransferase receptor GlpR n=1 Tax=Frankia tisae TaxID=2950104 RepID=UPI0034D42224